MLFDIAQAHRKAGHQEEALSRYELFLREDPRSPLRAEAEGHIQALRRRLFGAIATFELMAQCFAGQRTGTGFLAQDPANPESLLLVTSLHVVHGCDALSVQALTCAHGAVERNLAWRVPAGVEVRTWPEYDLAAIPVPPDRRPALLAAGEPTRLGPAEAVPAVGAEVSVPAGPKAVCGRGHGRLNAELTLGALMDRVAANKGVSGADAEALRGSLGRDRRLLLYLATDSPGPGSSGGPVTLPGSLTVIGVHQGGLLRFPLSWALLLPGSTLPDAVPAHLGGAWPAFVAPGLVNADLSDYPTEVQTVARRGKRQWFVSLATSVEAPFGALAGDWGFWHNVALSTEFLEWPASSLRHALGLRLAAGVLWGRAGLSFLGPDGSTLETQDGGKLGGVAELALQLRFLRLSPIRPSVDLGVRGGWLRQDGPRDPAGMESSTTDLVIGFPLRGRVAFSLSGYHSIVVELGLVAQYQPTAAYRYPGVALPVVPEGRAFGLLGSFGVAYEY